MDLFLQDPDDPDGVYLFEELLEACKNARRGGGAFAFATAAGAKLLLENEEFVVFAAENSFDLIVGIDAVTNNQALNAIAQAMVAATGLSAHVFLHERPDSLFHPKFCWFRGPRGGRLIVGSGNLTVGGLRTNWEGFTVTSLDGAQAEEVEASWERWKAMHAGVLLEPDDPRVVARASRNTGWVRLVRSEESTEGGGGVEAPRPVEERATGPVRQNNLVLIAEIPRGDRWKQANFDLDNYQNFFGARVGTQRRILLQHVNEDGTLAEPETRPRVAVPSQNYRFELGAASGRAYPRTGGPIGVFVRVAPRTFRYRLLMPGDADYPAVEAFLDERWDGPARYMRRVRAEASELRQAWPNAALWSAT